MKVAVIPASKCRRVHVKHLHVSTSPPCITLFTLSLSLSFVELKDSIPFATSCHEVSLQVDLCCQKTEHFLLEKDNFTLLFMILILIV